MEALDFKLDGEPAKSSRRREVRRLEVHRRAAERPHRPRRFCRRALPCQPADARSRLAPAESRIACRSAAVEDGTAIGSALATSVNRLRDQPSKSKIVVLLTDGQNNAGKIMPETAAQAAKALGVKVYTIAAGVRGEAPVPVTDAFGNKRLAMAKVDVDEDTLKMIAERNRRKILPRDRHGIAQEHLR